MKRLIAKLLLFLLSAALVLPFTRISGSELAFALAALALALTAEIWGLRRGFRFAYISLLCLLAFALPALRSYAPLFLFDCELWGREKEGKNRPRLWGGLLLLLFHALAFLLEGPVRPPVFYLLLCLGPFMEGLCFRASSREQRLRVSRDYYEGKLIEQEREKRREEQLASEKRELARLEERERLARELHDVTGHSLSSAILQVGALQVLNQNEKLAVPLSALQQSLEKGLSDVRTTLHALQAESCDLEAEFRRLLASAEGFRCSLSYAARLPLSRELRLDLLAIAREAVTNALRHSGGSELELRFRASGSIISLEIRDNGKGLSPENAKARQGFGLENLEQAARRQDGILDFFSEAGQGLCVRFTKILRSQAST